MVLISLLCDIRIFDMKTRFLLWGILPLLLVHPSTRAQVGPDVIIPRPVSAEVSPGEYILSRDGKYGVQAVTGEWIAQPIFADAGPFIGGLAPLKTEDGRWGMIDTDGNIVLPFTYDSISQVSSGLIACWREENGWSILRIME